jgi:hypothetical protein
MRDGFWDSPSLFGRLALTGADRCGTGGSLWTIQDFRGAPPNALAILPFLASVVNTDESGVACLDSSVGATERTNRNSLTAFGQFHRST